MTDVREVTWSDVILLRLVISSSVMLSAKYSCSGSWERFSRGRTAMDWMRTGAALPSDRVLSLPTSKAKSRVSPHRNAIADIAAVGSSRILDQGATAGAPPGLGGTFGGATSETAGSALAFVSALFSTAEIQRCPRLG